MLAKAGPLNEAQVGFVGHIHAAAEHMNELVQNLLELAKIDMGMEFKQETLDMNAFASDMLDEFQPQAETKKQKLLLEKTADRLMVQGDALQLKQALRNLIGNAIKYTRIGGSINLSLETDVKRRSFMCRILAMGFPQRTCRLSLIVFIAPMMRGLEILKAMAWDWRLSSPLLRSMVAGSVLKANPEKVPVSRSHCRVCRRTYQILFEDQSLGKE